MTTEQTELDVNASILKHIGMIKPWIPQRTVVSIGEYTSDLLRKLDFKNSDSSTLFVEKASQGTGPKLGSINTFEVDEKTDLHYWFNVQQYFAENEAFCEKLRNKTPEKLGSAIIVAATGEGIGSFLMPEVASRLKDQGVYSAGFAILPSQLQPPDAFFNALWCMGICEGEGIAQILVDRDGLEGYVGVDRKGSVLKGDGVFGYLLELVLNKEFFVQELCELGNSYNVNTFTVLAATGASLKVHGSLENILNTTLMKPFSTFDLTSSTVLYVLIRMPTQLQRKLSRGSIELTVNKWFKEKANLKSAIVSEPVYVNDGGDRVDIILFVGGFDLSKTAASIGNQVEDIVSYAVKNNFIKEKEWRELVKQLKR